ncbi:alpha/beta-hydrolase [Aspergillus sclerotiicarbonarius CBS 121057]|uniref:Alpha/beta-hydrolase n=1 Tax=Aspergillus sclerotiicarbonarius (strain CBS 121057 / IBT 28362) TaxID=1448318 RepID=A0A319F728_ASPSB|nr:alpha/beta-hydrolase [Aspergillus sclerotiicarbonarius CBS 121057]
MPRETKLAQDDINSSAIFQLSNDTEFAFVLETVLSLSNNRGAATAEVLRAASQITPGDFESWYNEFLYLGNAIHAKAAAIDSSRFPVSAREAYFRSSTYYRYAPFFLHANASDPRINTLGALAVDDFNRAAALLPLPAENIDLPASSPNIPGGDFYVPARFFKAQQGNAKLPTIIVGTGYDAAHEDIYHEIGVEILERGWNVITFEGPGQPTVLRDENLGFIPDWWNVVSPVVDYLETRPDVDMDHVALAGVSFGGELIPLAASREHRLSAVLAIDGMSSLYELFEAGFSATNITDLYDDGDYAKFDEEIWALEYDSSETSLRWMLAQSLFTFNTDSPSDWWSRLPAFTVNATMLANISCPVFIGEGENDSSAPGQAEEMVKAIGKNATYNLFRTDVGAGEHCQIGAEAQLAQVAWDWLADTWDHVRLPTNLTNVVA